MNAIVSPTMTAPVEAFSVDVSKGALDGTVSRQWSARPADQCFDDLNSLFKFKNDAFDRAFSGVANTDKLEFFAPEIKTKDDYRRLGFGASLKTGGDRQVIAEIEPNHWSFGQLCTLAGMPAGYFRGMPSQLVQEHLDWNFRYNRQVEEVGLYADSEYLRAATGPTYGRIPDHEIVQAVQKIAGNGLGDMHWKTPGKIDWSNGTYDPENMGMGRDRTFYGSDRDMFIFLVDDRRPICVGKTKDGNDDNLFRGFYIQNSEVGARALKISSFYLRGVCMNRNLWGCEGFQEITIRHTRAAPERWLEQCVPALESFSAASDALLIESVEKAKAAKLVKRADDGLAFLKSKQFNAKAAKAILDIHEHEEGFAPTTAWDFAQGITAFARSAINTDTRLSIELTAKKILDDVVHVAPLEIDFADA